MRREPVLTGLRGDTRDSPQDFLDQFFSNPRQSHEFFGEVAYLQAGTTAYRSDCAEFERETSLFSNHSPARWQIVLRSRFRVPALSLKTDELGIPSFFAMARPEYPSFRNGNLIAVYAQRRPASEFDRAPCGGKASVHTLDDSRAEIFPTFPFFVELGHGKKIEAKAKETLFTPKPDSLADRCAGGRATRLRERGRRSPAAGPTPEAARETITAPKGFLINQRFACHHHDEMFEHTLPGSENIQQGFLNPRFFARVKAKSHFFETCGECILRQV